MLTIRFIPKWCRPALHLTGFAITFIKDWQLLNKNQKTAVICIAGREISRDGFCRFKHAAYKRLSAGLICCIFYSFYRRN